MTYEAAIDDESERVQELARADALVCSACVLDRDLWELVDDQVAEPGICDFCRRSAAETVTLAGLARVVLSTVALFYTPLADTNSYCDDGEWTVDYIDLDEVLWEFMQDVVASDVEFPLKEYVKSVDDTDYGWVDRGEILTRRFDYNKYEWGSFAGATRQSGMVLADYMMTLDPKVRKLFQTVLSIAEAGGNIKTGTLPPLWRGREAHPVVDYVTAKELGSPPDGVGGQNRMTPAGDSVFYGSTEERGAVIELVQERRGQDLPFWVGRFTASRPIRYLDTFANDPSPSPYSPGAADIASAHAFLRAFARSVSEPKPSPGAPSSHYLPTQVFVEFLRGLPEHRRVEAVRYASSLEPSSENWVVFVDQDHCVDEPALDTAELTLVLQTGSPVRLNGKDFT